MHLHSDYYVHQYFSPVLGLNAYFQMEDSGHPSFVGQPGNIATTVPVAGDSRFGGADLSNPGNGDGLVTGALGADLRPIKNLGVRGAYERQINDGQSNFGWRFTLSVIYAF